MKRISMVGSQDSLVNLKNIHLGTRTLISTSTMALSTSKFLEGVQGNAYCQAKVI